MSRLIVKNLPNNITAEKLKEHFSQKGLVTDVQLKYTKDGKFRHFGFVGYQNEEEAKNAIEYFNNTFIRSVKIEVQLCAGLGDSSKPKSWSKYAPDSSAFKKLHPKDEPEKEKEKSKKETKKEKLKNKTEEIIVEKMKKHKDDPLFMEYLEAHGKDAISILEKVKKVDEDSGVEDGNDDESGNNEVSKETAANADISDLEYLKLKMKSGNTQEEESKFENLEKNQQNKEKVKFFTVKVSDLPYNVTKSQLKELFRQMRPSSIRLPPRKKGFSYVCFKTEKHMKQALSKNKSFIGGKQISVKEYKNKGSDQEKSDASERWRQQEEILKQEENIAESGCIFVRNLSYTVTEEELQELFSKFGPITEVNVPVDRLTRRVKGFATLTFLMPEHAVQAYSELDGTVFHGRMLHLLPGKSKDGSNSYESNEDGNETYKKKKTKQLKENAGLSYNWNSLFLGQNAIADIIAQNYNASKEQVLMGNDAAVRMALGETQIVSETRQFLEDNGVKLDAFNQAPKKRSKTVILIKNLPANTNVKEIRELFVKFGELGRVVLPPTGVTGIVEFLEPSEARNAFVKLAYTKFKHLPLYLEWAPDDTFCSAYDRSEKNKIDNENKVESQADVKLKAEKDEEEEELLEDPEPDTTLFVKNLNFATEEKSLKEHFSRCGRVASVTIAKKKDPSRPGAFLSMGYGFVQFYKKNSLNNALKNLQMSELDNHKLELKRSNRTISTNVIDERKKNNVEKQTGSKILVRNIPFQATQKEVSQLFRTFGEIKALRLPKKMVGTGSHRGFCFVEYNSKSDAKRAMKALCQSTHLYGRRLVLEWAQSEESVDELRKRTAKNFLSSSEPTQTKRRKATANIDIGTNDDSDDE